MEEHCEPVENEVPSFDDLVPDCHVSKLVHPIFMAKLPYLEGMAFMPEAGVIIHAKRLAIKIESYFISYVLSCGNTNFMVHQRVGYYEP